jgi:hypothetical protein
MQGYRSASGAGKCRKWGKPPICKDTDARRQMQGYIQVSRQGRQVQEMGQAADVQRFRGKDIDARIQVSRRARQGSAADDASPDLGSSHAKDSDARKQVSRLGRALQEIMRPPICKEAGCSGQEYRSAGMREQQHLAPTWRCMAPCMPYMSTTKTKSCLCFGCTLLCIRPAATSPTSPYTHRHPSTHTHTDTPPYTDIHPSIYTQTHTPARPLPHLCAKVQLHDIIVLQHGVVAAVGRPVRGHPVEAAARGEGNPCTSRRRQQQQQQQQDIIISSSTCHCLQHVMIMGFFEWSHRGKLLHREWPADKLQRQLLAACASSA